MKRTLRNLALGFLFLGLILSVSATGAKEGAVEADQQFTVYAVVHGGIGDPYWKKVEKGIKDAEALVPDLKVIYTGPDVFRFEEFMAMLEAALTAKPDGLLATMTNPEAMDDLLREAISDGLPVIAIDSPDSRPRLERIPYLSYVGEIPYEGGVLMAKEVLRQYRPKRVLYEISQIGAVNLVERGRAIVDVMTEAGVPVEIMDTAEDPSRAVELILSYLRTHPETDTFNGEITHCEALVTRLEEEGIEPGVDIRISTYGLSDTIMDMMAEGKIDFSIDEQPYLQGFLGTTLMYLHIKYGFTPPSTIPTLGLFPEDISMLRDAVEKHIR